MEVHGWFGPATGSNLVGGMVDFGTGMAANHRSTWRWPWFRAQSCGQARLSRLCASGKISKRNRFKCLEEAWPRWQSWLRLQAELRDFLFWSVGTVGNEVPCPAEVQKNLMIGYDGQFPSGLNERPIMWRSRLTMFRTSGLRVFLCSYVPMFWHYPALRVDIGRHGFRLGPI